MTHYILGKLHDGETIEQIKKEFYDSLEIAKEQYYNSTNPYNKLRESLATLTLSSIGESTSKNSELIPNFIEENFSNNDIAKAIAKEMIPEYDTYVNRKTKTDTSSKEEEKINTKKEEKPLKNTEKAKEKSENLDKDAEKANFIDMIFGDEQTRKTLVKSLEETLGDINRMVMRYQPLSKENDVDSLCDWWEDLWPCNSKKNNSNDK